MAWQGGSSPAGGGGSRMGEAAGVQAYTLQGVMRFLQTEWHRHERDRNAWEIERAEMKSRIGRLEGEQRTSKKLHESMGKHVKILEIALKKERERVKNLVKGENVDVSRDPKEVAKAELEALGRDAHLKRGGKLEIDLGPDDQLGQGIQQETEREKSKSYLSKSAAEITYHVMPMTHIPPELSDPPLNNHVSTNQQPVQQGMQEVYVRQPHQQQKQQHGNNMNMVRENPVRNHPQIPSSYNENLALTRSNTQINHGALPIRETRETNVTTPVTALDARLPLFDHATTPDNQVESVVHSYDVYGKQVPAREGAEFTQPSEESREISDGWDFDDHAPAVEPQPEVPPPTYRADTDIFPNASLVPPKSPPRGPAHRRKSSGTRRRSEGSVESRDSVTNKKDDAAIFKVKFALRGHLDVVRSVIFTGGGSPSEPEICTAGDDGCIKRWTIPASYGNFSPHGPNAGYDLDITSYFTHRGHDGAVTSLAACRPSPTFANGGRAPGDGWIFSGGQDASVKVWERGRVDPKATLEGHKDAVWALCVLPGTAGSLLGDRCNQHGGPDRMLLATGAADGTIMIWAVSAPPQVPSAHIGSNRGLRASRRANSISAGSDFPSSPQPSTATSTPFHYSLVHQIVRADCPSPTCISPLNPTGDTFVVSYTDASILVFDTRTSEEVVGMASLETYDGTPSTGVNAIVASTTGFDGTLSLDPSRGLSEDDALVHGATGSRGGVEGVIISGYEDRYIRFFDANSGQCTYTMLAHPSAISSLSLSPDGRELVSAGHDASLRFWSLETRSCNQEITSHRIMRGEGVCSVVWSQDGRWVVSAGGDGVVKVFTR